MRTGINCKKLAQAAGRLGLASLLLSPGELRAQCAMCWQALANSAEGKNLVQGFADGILFLLPVPFLVVGIIGFLIYKAHRSRAPGDWPSETELGHLGDTGAPGQVFRGRPDAVLN